MARALTKATRQRAREAFLAALRFQPNITLAARAAGLSRQTMYEWAEKDEAFAAEWVAALEEGIDLAEAEMWRRGVEGWDEPVYGRVGKDQDGEVGTVRRHSDAMLTLALKAHRPEKYRERTDVQHSGKIEVEYTNDWRAPGTD